MNKIQFIKQIRATAEALKPLTEAVKPGALIWNGTEYAKYTEEAKTPNPYALAWWFTLISIAELIEAQESPTTEKQTKYLERLLFGGMGSLNDLSFDSNDDVAKAVNEQLNKERSALFDSFKND